MMHSGAPSDSGPTAPRTATEPQPPLPPPPAAPDTDNELLASLTQLNLHHAAANPLPPTPRSTTPCTRNPSASRTHRVEQPLPPTSARKAKPPPFGGEQSVSGGHSSPILRRQASAGTLEARSTPPTLLRKASMNSLQKANAGAHSVNGGSHSPRAEMGRRSSYTQDTGNIGRHSAMGRSPLRGMDEAVDEGPVRPIRTAEAIACEYFTKELGAQHTNGTTINQDGAGDEQRQAETETIVILHDACYGHRFSRPKTSKANLLTIVERPERIHASILGVAAAYVKLGERGSDERYAIKPAKGDDDDDDDKENKPPPRPFAIHKSSRRVGLGEQAVTSVHGVKWMEELKTLCQGAEAKLAHNGKELIRPCMDRGKGAEEPRKFHEGDLYLCKESLDAMEGALGAVCDGVDAVFSEAAAVKTKRAFVVVRPPGHHCSAGYPSGFCWVNNVHVGIQHAALNHGLTHAAIIDFDLHHGDGSQDIAWGHNERVRGLPKNAPAWKKAAIGYFSLHDINSYPCEWSDMEKVKNASLCIENAHGQNIWNVHLAPWNNEQEFWGLYESKYAVLLEKTRLFLRGQTQRIMQAGEKGKGGKPRAAIFLSAGFDASEHESDGMQRHKVNVPTEFYARLTRDVRRIADEEGTGVEGRIVSVLEGGYSDRALCSGVFSHISGLAGSDPETYEMPVETTGLGAEVARRMGNLFDTSSEAEHALPPYDPSWWALSNLEALEAADAPQPEPEQPKKPRENGPPATYYASTQSFDAKITETPKGRRSSSGLFAHPPPHGYKPQPNSPHQLVRAPTLPPPDVSWAVAAKELCKVLIPTDRQTMSCKPEELGAAATRERKERMSLTLLGAKDLLVTPPQFGPVSPELTSSIRKSTRERKPTRQVDTAAEEAARAAAANRAARRRTVAGAAVIATETSRPGLPPRGSTARQVPTATRVLSRRDSLAWNADEVMGGMDTPPAPNLRTQGNDGAAESVQQHSRTSSNVKGEFSASTRGGAAGVAVRKTRPPSAPRASTAGVIARAPVSRQASGAMGAPPPAAGRRAAHASQVDGPSERSGGRGVSAEMENLSKGMGGVRITLTTKAQREAKAAAEATKEARQISATAPYHPATDGANSHKPSDEVNEPEKGVKRETTEHKMGMRTPPSQTTEVTRPEYSSSTSQLHASQQLSSFSSEEEEAQAVSTRNLDQAQHEQQRREEQQEADQYERDQKNIVEQLAQAAKAAAEIAEERGAISSPPRPTTSGSGTSAGVASPSSIQNRIQRLAQVSNVALESAREMGSGRSSFSDMRSPPGAGSGGRGEFERAGPVGVKREELPVWSSTGIIPFAPVKKEDIWEVPETPRK